MPKNEQAIESIISKVNEILSVPTERLITNYKNTESGVIECPEIRPQVEELRLLLQFVSKGVLQSLPDFQFTVLESAFNTIFAALNRLHTYKKDRQTGDLEQARHLSEFFIRPNDGFKTYFRDSLWPSIHSGVSLRAFGILNDPASNRLAELDDLMGKMREAKREIDSVLETARTEVAKGGVSKHQEIFQNQSQVHRKNAENWGKASIALIILDASIIVGMYFAVKNAAGTNMITLGILSGLLISLVSYTIVISVKSYMAEKHNEIVNRHKANCLGSYNTFAESASDELRDVILQYTTQTIFSPFNPGYLSKDVMQSPLPVIEMLRTVQTERKQI